MQTNTTITHVNLNENNLGSAGAIAMAGAIKSNRTLEEVDLSLNYIDDSGGKV